MTQVCQTPLTSRRGSLRVAVVISLMLSLAAAAYCWNAARSLRSQLKTTSKDLNNAKVQAEESQRDSEAVRSEIDQVRDLHEQKEDELERELKLEHSFGLAARSDAISRFRPTTALLLAAESVRQDASVHDVTLQALLHRLNTLGGSLLPPRDAAVTAVEFLRDGRRLAVADAGGHISVVPLGGWNRTPSLELPGHQGAVRALDSTDDGRYLVSAGEDSTVRIWDLESVDPVHFCRVLRRHKDAVTAVLITDDDQAIVSGSRDGIVRLWDLNGKSVSESRILASCPNSVRELFVSADLDWGIAGDDSGNLLSLSNLRRSGQSASEPPPLDLQKGTLLASSDDGRTIAIGEKSGRIHVHRLAENAWRSKSISSSEQVARLAMDPAGTWLISRLMSGIVKAWRLEFGDEGEPLPFEIGLRAVKDLRLTVGNPPFALLHAQAEQESVHVHRLAGGGSSLVGQLQPGPAGAEVVSVSPSMARVAVGSSDGSLRVWDLDAALSGALPVLINRYSQAVESIRIEEPADAPPGVVVQIGGRRIERFLIAPRPHFEKWVSENLRDQAVAGEFVAGQLSRPSNRSDAGEFNGQAFQEDGTTVQRTKSERATGEQTTGHETTGEEATGSEVIGDLRAVWDGAARIELTRERSNESLVIDLPEPMESITELFVDQDLHAVLAGGKFGDVLMCRVSDSMPLRLLESRLVGRHSESVQDAVFLDQSRCAVTGWNGEISVLDLTELESRKSPAVFKGHDGAVTALVVGAVDGSLWSAGIDGTVRRWGTSRENEQEPALVLKRHAHPVEELVIHSSVESGQPPLLLTGDRSGEIVVSTFRDNGEVQEEFIKLEGHSGAISDIKVAGEFVFSASLDRSVRRWNLTDDHPSLNPLVLRDCGGSVTSIAVTNDALTVVCATSDGSVAYWPLQPDVLLKLAEQTAGRPFTEHERLEFRIRKTR